MNFLFLIVTCKNRLHNNLTSSSTLYHPNIQIIRILTKLSSSYIPKTQLPQKEKQTKIMIFIFSSNKMLHHHRVAPYRKAN